MIDIAEVPADVKSLFEKFTLDVIERGYSRYSSDAVLHRIRWTMKIERGDREFKCNDHWTSALSRWFMKQNPQYAGFFETRVIKNAAGAVDDEDFA